MEEEDAGVRKRKRDGEAGGGGVVSGEAASGGGYYEKELVEEDEDRYEGIAEESVEDLMRWLEMEISLAPGKDVDGADEDDGFVTINGNEESCGPSFSAAASTVMASLDTRAGAPPPPTAFPWPWPSVPDPAEASSRNEADADLAEFDERWLVELLTLTGGPALEA